MKTKKIKTVQFERVEKKAIFVMAFEVVLADGTVHPDELKAMRQLQEEVSMDANLVHEASKTTVDEALVTLNNMTFPKKKVLAKILENMAISDNYLHDQEMNLIIETFKNIGIGGETE